MKTKILSVITFVALFAVSCDKFFDVSPVDRLYENDLFNDRYGFETSLSAVYSTLGGTSMYGKELSYGFMETLVGSYNNLTATGHTYYRDNRYEYSFAGPQGRIGAIWSGFYSSINQVNIILQNIDNISNDPYYNIVKGEALGLRAFSHFQVLKLFGPVISEEGLDVKAIPYRDSLRYEATKFGTAREVIGKIRKDLMQAKSLLESDPIRTNSRIADLNRFAYERYNSLIDRRGVRMNYYAIVALQALLAQWEGDLSAAGSFAEELINELNTTNTMTFASPNNFVSGDLRLSSENILGLHIRNLRLYALDVLPALADTRGVVSPLLYPNYTFLLNNLYNAVGHGTTNDYRLAGWYANNTRWKLIKYAIPEGYNPVATVETSNSNYLQINAFEMKLLSLHTIYLVAAESYKQSNPQKALNYLNIVRRTRGLNIDIPYTVGMTPESITDQIFYEFRKDNIGDGTLFAEYKRLYRPIERATNVAPSLSIFKLPVPNDELLYNPN